jgi:uracil-DNA glycosylase
MLDRMLLNVLMVERADTWLLEANACAAAAGSCRDTLRRQLDVVGPRLILGLGAGVGPLLGGLPPVLGEWAAWGEADVLLTFHPSELVRRPADKRPALEHLNTLRRRL